MDQQVHKMQPVNGRGMHRAFAILGVLLFIGICLSLTHSSLPPAPAAAATNPEGKKQAIPTPRAVESANAFLDSLDSKQRDKALLKFDSNKKSQWSNLPVTFVKRNGVKLGDLTKDQRAKAMAVVASVLSKDGYQKVIDIMDGDQILVDRPGKGKGKGKGGQKGPMFGKDLYYLAIFGQPSETKPWMVQFGGHHLGVNVTVIGKHFVLTPTHTGAQPTLFKRGNMDVRPLGREKDTAYKLLASLNQKQRKQAIISERAQSELLLGPGRDGRKIEPKGIKGSELTEKQKALLMDVIAAWVNIVEPDSAAGRLAAINKKISETYFAWSGPTERGEAAYFRIQGPAVVIEYAPQGGTDHIHTVIRNPQDDYGEGLIKR